MEPWGRARVLAALAVVFLVLVAALIAASPGRVARSLGAVTGLAPDCTVVLPRSPGGHDLDHVELSTAEAQAAATAAAHAVRRSWTAERATVEVSAEVSRTGSDLDSQDARTVATALTGRRRAALSCRVTTTPSEERDALSRRGLTARAETVRADLLDAFGRLPLGGYAPGGVRSGHMNGSAHYAGRAIDVFFRPINPAHRQRGWAVAQYLVANAERLDVRTVIYDRRIWTAARSDEGWRAYRPDVSRRSRAVAQTLQHRDHVHVDVAD